MVVGIFVEEPAFDKSEMRRLLDGHDLELRDGLFSLMASSDLFVSSRIGGDTVFASPDFDEPMDAMREKVWERIRFLLRHDVFKNFLTDQSVASYLRRNAVFETLNIFDHGLAVKLGVHYNLWFALHA